MAKAPVFFKKNGLIVPQIIPANVIKNFCPSHLYAVQVTAKQRTTAALFGTKPVAIPPIPGAIMVFQVQVPPGCFAKCESDSGAKMLHCRSYLILID